MVQNPTQSLKNSVNKAYYFVILNLRHFLVSTNEKVSMYSVQSHMITVLQQIGFASDSEEKEYSQFVLQSLSEAVRVDKFPKSTVDIDILVLQNDGGMCPRLTEF